MTNANRIERIEWVSRFYSSYLCDKGWLEDSACIFDCSVSTIRSDIYRLKVQKLFAYTKLIPTPYEKAHVMTRDNSTCQYCGVINPEFWAIEHVIPCLKGGITDTCNLVFACKSCNKKKGGSIWTPKNINILALENKEWTLKIQYKSVRRYDI